MTLEETQFAGVGFHLAGADDIAAWVQRTALDAPFRYVVTPNVDHLVQLDRDARLAAAYEGASIRVNDSRVLRRLGKLYGRELGHLPGSDLTAHLLTNALPRDFAINLIGGGDDVAPILADTLGLTGLRHWEPPMGFTANPTQIGEGAAFCAERPGLTVIAIGSPRQEWLAHGLTLVPDLAGVGICVGASLDFLTGRQKRAPLAFQRAGLEWLYRLASQPRRLAKRYLIDGPQVALRIYREEHRHSRSNLPS